MSEKTKQAAFTPGPWTMGRAHNKRLYVFAPDGMPICGSFVDARPEAANANASLCAAAPDLYDACKALLAMVEELPQGHSAERVTSAIAAKAAIARAEGKAP